MNQAIGITDLHSDLPLALLHRRFEGVTGSLRDEWLPRLRAGGVNTVVCAIYIDSIFLPEGALRRAVQLVDALLEEIALCPDAVELALTTGDLDRITGAGKIAVLLMFEGAEPFGQDLAGLRLFHRLGMRICSFAWMRRTAYGDGAWENDSRGGLTRLGHAAVAELNRLGIVTDVSHCSDQTTWDVLAASTKPVIASHSNARAVADQPRNLTDDMAKAIAASGGLVGMVAVAGYVAPDTATVSRWVDHFDHVASLVGVDYLGLGLDFFTEIMAMNIFGDVPAWGPPGGLVPLEFAEMATYRDLPNLTEELLRRGYTDDDLRKIYGGNFRRVLRAVETA
ncbi:MAG: dipeptidase [Thermomicrobiales bacterium]|nr:dipeptidase [Thermomicrobiales bacterium]